jgi:hypothetical protein
MTYDIIKAGTQRQAFTVIEIILDKNDPALDATFALQADSYGTPKTTDDPLAYTGTDFRTYRYSDQQLFGVDHFPNLIKATSTAPKIDPGKSIGFRATATAEIRDFVDGDEYALPSPYDDRRVSGSHFLKLLARNHVKNRRARVIKGFNPFDYDEANCQIESYVIDEISQPSESGIVYIKMIDELILTESAKSKVPELSKGQLNGDINAVVGALTFTSTIIDEYGAVSATGHICIEKEVMAYTVATSTTMTITRSRFGTEAKEHKSLETIQKCVAFDDVNIIDIITQLITDHTNIPASYIPTAEWAALKAGDLAAYNLTNVLFKPDDIKKILNELIQIAGLSMYVDVIENSLKIITVPDFSIPQISYDDDQHLILGSVKAPFKDKEQITRQSIFWDKSSVTDGNEDRNYRKRFQVIDSIVEAPADIYTTSEPTPFKCNWLINSSEDNQLATSYAQRNVNRFSQIPREISFDIDQNYIGTVSGGRLWLGAVFDITTNKILDSGLNKVTTTCQCTQIKETSKDGIWNVTGLTFIASAPLTADLFITEDKTDYLLTDELITDEAREYVVVINSGVKICGSAAAYSFSQGTFFAGATLKLYVLGQILGRGGTGGDGGDYSNPPPTQGTGGNGSTGYDALNLTTDTIIDNGFGIIYSGGGGGGGYQGTGSRSGDGGGGGQGCSGGVGGPFGSSDGADGDVGDAGSQSGPGSNGGAWGESGGAGDGSTGGAAGNAINKNGNTVTIIAGNNSLQIKGLIV